MIAGESLRILESLFIQVSARGVPIGPRDYMDALAALRQGFGLLTRARLLALCITLWTRTEEEAALVSAVFQQIAPPSRDEIAQLNRDGPSFGETPIGQSVSRDANETIDNNFAGASESDIGRARVQIASSSGHGVALPAVQLGEVPAAPFVMSSVPLVSRRQMTVHWRRFRVQRRDGPRTELDLQASIDRQCRNGYLDAPVFASTRRNRARLVLAIDVSASMATWRDFCEDLVHSLEESRLGGYQVYFFENVPDVLYRTSSLHGASTLDEAVAATEGSAAFFVGDDGAARARHDSGRVAAMKKCLDRARSSWEPIVWLNPMPRHRWRGTGAELTARDRRLSTIPLGAEEFARAIDLIRGTRAS